MTTANIIRSTLKWITDQTHKLLHWTPLANQTRDTRPAYIRDL